MNFTESVITLTTVMTMTNVVTLRDKDDRIERSWCNKVTKKGKIRTSCVGCRGCYSSPDGKYYSSVNRRKRIWG